MGLSQNDKLAITSIQYLGHLSKSWFFIIFQTFGNMLQDGEWERACDELGRKMLDDTILHTSDFKLDRLDPFKLQRQGLNADRFYLCEAVG